MNRNTHDASSNPLSRVFSKIFHHDDPAPASTPPSATPHAAAPHAPVPAAHPPASGTSPHAAPSTVAPGAANTGAAPQAAAATPIATPTTSQRTYTVVAGDSLSKIAQHLYGRADAWPALFDANRDRIHDPDLIHPGQVLVVPDAPGTH